MAQNGPIIIKDSAAADVTLTPVYKDGLLATYSDRTADTGLRIEASLGMRKPKSSLNGKIQVQVKVPYATVVDDITATEVVTAFVDIVIPPAAPTPIRNELVAAVSSIVTDTIVNDLLVNDGFPY